jgi:hypothetical protein
MIIPMTTTGRLQQRDDHRLRDLVHGTGNMTIAADLGVPRSTARGWLGKAPKVVLRLDVTDLEKSELRQEVLELRRRVKKLTALLRLALALLRSSRFSLTHERLPDGRAKIRILRAVDRAREFVPLRAVLVFLRLSPGRFHVAGRFRVPWDQQEHRRTVAEMCGWKAGIRTPITWSREPLTGTRPLLSMRPYAVFLPITSVGSLPFRCVLLRSVSHCVSGTRPLRWRSQSWLRPSHNLSFTNALIARPSPQA